MFTAAAGRRRRSASGRMSASGMAAPRRGTVRRDPRVPAIRSWRWRIMARDTRLSCSAPTAASSRARFGTALRLPDRLRAGGLARGRLRPPAARWLRPAARSRAPLACARARRRAHALLDRRLWRRGSCRSTRLQRTTVVAALPARWHQRRRPRHRTPTAARSSTSTSPTTRPAPTRRAGSARLRRRRTRCRSRSAPASACPPDALRRTSGAAAAPADPVRPTRSRPLRCPALFGENGVRQG